MKPVTNQLGYRHGLRQPAELLILRIACPDNVNFAALDNWIEVLFEEKVEAQCLPIHIIELNEKNIRSFAWRVLLIGRAFQQIARIPIFEAGRILGAKIDPNRPSVWYVETAISKVDLIPQKCTAITYHAAINIALWFVTHEQTAANIEILYEHIEKKVLEPLASLVKAGVSTLPILNQAYQQDIPFRHLGAGTYQLGWGHASRLMDRSAIDADSAIGCKLARKKDMTAHIIRSAGLPASEHIMVSSMGEALQAADKLGWPLVVKPNDRERGEGVTVGINDSQKFVAGLKTAFARSQSILVEREVAGICYRLLVANGQLLYALCRRPKSVIGDGKNTIAELVDKSQVDANKKPPWLRAKSVPLDTLAIECITEQGFASFDVPKIGELVGLRKIESSEWGGNVEDATGLVHPENVDIAVRVARLFGLLNAGIDIISTDIARPWHENGAIINEVNYAPYFGGNQIAKAKIPTFFQGFISGNGRIPVEVYLGGDEAMQEGKARQRELLEAGIQCYLTSHLETKIDTKRTMAFPERGLFNRTIALLMNRDVEALILVIQTDEFLHTGLPIDIVSKINFTEDDLLSCESGNQLSLKSVKVDLLKLLSKYEKFTSRD